MGFIAELITELFEPKAVKPIPVRKSSGAVKRGFDPLWKERNWSKQGNTYKGYFRTRYGSYQGEILERGSGFIQFFITNPPTCLARHSHSQCFFHRKGNTYEVHFSKKAKTPDEGIIAIERILREAHQLP
jgi:hypothetical protein